MSANTVAGTAASAETPASGGARPNSDKPRAVIEAFKCYEIGPKVWGTETVVACTDQYLGKVLRMRAGESGPFQYHELKNETFHLVSGIARITYKTAEGVTRSVKMYAGESYHVPPGAPHKVEALQECIFFEASTPVFEDRVPVE